MSKSRKPPWLRKRIKRRMGEGTRIAASQLLLDARTLTDRPNDAAVPSGPVTRTGWLTTHPRFHDPLHETRMTKAPSPNTGAGFLMSRSGKAVKPQGFKPWYGAHNEHKPPKPVK